MSGWSKEHDREHDRFRAECRKMPPRTADLKQLQQLTQALLGATYPAGTITRLGDTLTSAEVSQIEMDLSRCTWRILWLRQLLKEHK